MTTNIGVFVSDSFEGVVAGAIIKKMITDSRTKTHTNFMRKMDFSNPNLFGFNDINLVIGLPYRGELLPESYFDSKDYPFEDFIHVSTYGEEIIQNGVISIVQDLSPLKVLQEMIEHNQTSTVLGRITETSQEVEAITQALEDYRLWTWENNTLTKTLLALYEASYTELENVIDGYSIQEIVTEFKPFIIGRIKAREKRIKDKLEEAYEGQIMVNNTLTKIKFVFSDDYVNEVGNALIAEEEDSVNVIACVGSTTRSSDLIRIRTRGVYAEDVAQWIDEKSGVGKENVASVFSATGYSNLMGKAIKKAIEEKVNF